MDPINVEGVIQIIGFLAVGMVAVYVGMRMCNAAPEKKATGKQPRINSGGSKDGYVGGYSENFAGEPGRLRYDRDNMPLDNQMVHSGSGGYTTGHRSNDRTHEGSKQRLLEDKNR